MTATTLYNAQDVQRPLVSYRATSGIAKNSISSVTLCIAIVVIPFALPRPAANKISASKYLDTAGLEYKLSNSLNF